MSNYTHANKMDNLEEIEKFLEKYNVPKLNQEEIENFNTHHKHGNWNCNQESSNKQKPMDQMASKVNSNKNSDKSYHLTYSKYSRKLQRKKTPKLTL